MKRSYIVLCFALAVLLVAVFAAQVLADAPVQLGVAGASVGTLKESLGTAGYSIGKLLH